MAVSATSQPKSGGRYALCVGIGTYASTKVRKLCYAVDDAKAIEEVLSDPARGNFEVRLLTTPEKTTREVLEDELYQIVKSSNRQPHDLVVIYFSCHGEVYGNKKNFCLLPSNAVIEEDDEVKDTTVISVFDIARRLSNTKVKNIIVLLDVCYSGGAGDALQYSIQNLSPDNSIYIIAAAQRDKIATQSSKLGHGIFTDALLCAFRQKPHRSDDGWLTITDIQSFVSKTVESHPSFKQGRISRCFVSTYAVNPNLPIVKNPHYSKESVDFFGQVKQLLELLHYEEVDIGNPQEAPAGFYIADVQAGVAVQRVGIIPCYNKVEDVTIEEARRIVSFVKEKVEKEYLVDLGLLVIAQEIATREVKAVFQEYISLRRLIVITVENIWKHLVNFKRYLSRLIEQYEKPDPQQADGRPPLAEVYIPLLTEQGDLEEAVRAWLSDAATTSTRCVILGDYGSGKSTFCEHLAVALAKEYQDQRDDALASARIPVLIPLSDFGKSFDLEGHLINHLKKCRIENADFDGLIEMAKRGMLLFIFDGFDEMVSRATTDVLRKNIAQIETWAKTEQFGRNKVLVTTRPEYFMNLHEEQQIIQRYVCLYIKPFNEAQVDLYLQKRIPCLKASEGEAIQDWKYYREQIDGIYNLTDLTHRPVLLEMIIKTWPDLIARGQSINRPSLYREYLEGELERQNRKSGRHLSIGREQRFEIVGRIALELYRTDSTEFSSAQIEGISFDLLTTDQQKELEGVLREIIACSFLIRKGDTYRFSHESFWEYLVAYQLAKGIKNKTQEHFHFKLISKTIREFIVELIKPESIEDEKTTCEKGTVARDNEYVKELERWFCEKPQHHPTSANVFSLLVRMLPRERVYTLPLQEANLAGADLSEIQLQKAPLAKARLEEANLRDAHLEEADLGSARLQRATLTGVYLIGARLTSARLEEANLLGAHLSDARLEGVNLMRSNLEGADLKGANLFGAHLEMANLRGADLKGADLVGAHLKKTNLKRADLAGVRLTDTQREGAFIEE